MEGELISNSGYLKYSWCKQKRRTGENCDHSYYICIETDQPGIFQEAEYKIIPSLKPTQVEAVQGINLTGAAKK